MTYIETSVGKLNYEHIDKRITVHCESEILQKELFVEDRGKEITSFRQPPYVYVGTLHAINFVGVENSMDEYVSVNVTLIFQDVATLWDIPPETPVTVEMN